MALFISVEVSTLSHLASGSHDQVVKNGMSRQILTRCANHQHVLQRSSLENSAVIIVLRHPNCYDCPLSCAKASTNAATKIRNARVHCHFGLATASGSSVEQRSWPFDVPFTVAGTVPEDWLLLWPCPCSLTKHLIRHFFTRTIARVSVLHCWLILWLRLFAKTGLDSRSWGEYSYFKNSYHSLASYYSRASRGRIHPDKTASQRWREAEFCCCQSCLPTIPSVYSFIAMPYDAQRELAGLEQSIYRSFRRTHHGQELRSKIFVLQGCFDCFLRDNFNSLAVNGWNFHSNFLHAYHALNGGVFLLDYLTII